MSEKSQITLSVNDDPDFAYKVVKQGWATEIYDVDDEGRRRRGQPTYHRFWPTREKALEHLQEIAVEDTYVKGRWWPISATHGYQEAGVRYFEEVVDAHLSLTAEIDVFEP